MDSGTCAKKFEKTWSTQKGLEKIFSRGHLEFLEFKRSRIQKIFSRGH